jgi:hypothetical protein
VGDAPREPQRHAATAVRAPYDRDAAPLLVSRVTNRSASRAVLDLALQGSAPDVAIAAITQPNQLDDLHRARSIAGAALAVDTRVLETAVGGYRSVAALRGRLFLPTSPELHTLRATGELARVARGDVQEQLHENADVLRAAALRPR